MATSRSTQSTANMKHRTLAGLEHRRRPSSGRTSHRRQLHLHPASGEHVLTFPFSQLWSVKSMLIILVWLTD